MEHSENPYAGERRDPKIEGTPRKGSDVIYIFLVREFYYKVYKHYTIGRMARPWVNYNYNSAVSIKGGLGKQTRRHLGSPMFFDF